MDSLEKCLWAMDATGKIAHFAIITRRNISSDIEPVLLIDEKDVNFVK